MELSRRDFLKMVGLGAAAAGLGSLAGTTPAQASSVVKPAAMVMP